MEENKEIEYKKYHYEVLTKSSQLETLINYYICTYFFKENEQKINFTNLVTHSISSSNIFKIFENILKSEKKEIPYSENKMRKVVKMRNNFAHSYFVPTNNSNLKKEINITKIHSNGNSNDGFSFGIQINEIIECIKILDEVIFNVNEMNTY